MSVGLRAKNRDHWQRVQSASRSRRARTPPVRLHVNTTVAPFDRLANGNSCPNFQLSNVYNPQFQTPKPFSRDLNMPMPEPQPRSFEELHTERSYLLASLQQENFKATDLLRKIPPLEQGLVQTQMPQVRTKTKKQLGWLRYRIDEITRQEKAILARLGELTYEIQSRERWCQIESEQRLHEQLLDSHLTLWGDMQQRQVNTGSLALQPQGYPVPYATWSTAPFIEQKPANGLQPSIQSYAPEPPITHRYMSELPAQTYDRNDAPTLNENLDSQALGYRRPSLLHRSSSMNEADMDTLATSSIYEPPPKAKRNSLQTLPGIPTAWGDKEDQ
jgi:hypothetical protein